MRVLGASRRLLLALLAIGVLVGAAGCDGDPETVLEVSTVELEATSTEVATSVPTQPPQTPPPTPIPTTEVPPAATPEATVEPTPTPDRSAEEFLASLADEFHFVLAEEFEFLAEISAEWNPDSRISMAVVLPDETLHGYQATESRISASAVKPLWAAAALDAAGVEAARPIAYSALILSDNLAGGRLIDLAGGVDAVNAWTWNVAGLDDTRLEAWRFQDPNRVASNFQPENPLGNRTTMADMALFFARLYKGELLDPDENAALQQWLLDTSHSLTSPRDLDGVLLDRLPSQVAESSLHKAGWLRPNCCPAEYRQMIDAGIIVLPDGSWFAMAIMSARGEFFDLTNQWVSLAACRIYAFVAEDREHFCGREGDGVHDPEIWPEAG
ncbi:serine hydrolase [Candidatus Poriferisocius sp.]|uniref:serine hydrolase n=1 Tax=Candidatus Poriferisocius sp. TaxID=3101276 RepID=UPI003B022343